MKNQYKTHITKRHRRGGDGLQSVAERQMIKYGYASAVGAHFWTDIFWHVIFGAF